MDDRLKQIDESSDEIRRLSEKLRRMRNEYRRLTTLTFDYAELKSFLINHYGMYEEDVQAIVRISREKKEERRKEELQRI